MPMGPERLSEGKWVSGEKTIHESINSENDDLLEQYREADNEDRRVEIRNRIAELNSRLVHFVISKRFPTLDRQRREDCYSEGYVGLLRAIEEYKFEKDTKFSTWACEQIYYAVLRSFRQKSVETLSLDEPIARDSDGSEGATLADRIPDDGPTVPDQVIDSITEQQRRLAPLLDKVFAGLPEQRRVLSLNYGLDGNRPHDAREISAQLNIPVEKVRQVINKATARLRLPAVKHEMRRLLEQE